MENNRKIVANVWHSIAVLRGDRIWNYQKHRTDRSITPGIALDEIFTEYSDSHTIENFLGKILREDLVAEVIIPRLSKKRKAHIRKIRRKRFSNRIRS